MTALSPSSPVPSLSHLLLQTLSDSQQERSSAEALLASLRSSQPEPYVLSLASLLSDPTQPETARESACVLLRQSLLHSLVPSSSSSSSFLSPPPPEERREIWSVLSLKARRSLQELLLHRFHLHDESSSPLQNKIIDIIAVVVSRTTLSHWPEFIPALLVALRASQEKEAAKAMRLLEKVCENVEEVGTLKPFLDPFKASILKGLQSSDLELRHASLSALIALLTCLEEKEMQVMRETIPFMFQALQAAYQEKQEELLIEGCQVLTSLVHREPSFLRSHLKPILAMMTSMVNDIQLNDEARRSAMEFLLSLCEEGKGMIRAQNEFARTVIPLAFAFLLHVEHSSEWEELNADEEDEYDGFENFKFGREAIQRLTAVLGAKQFLPIALPIIEAFANNVEHWQHRHAAFVAIIAMVPELEEKQLLPLLDSFVRLIVPHFRDPHVRVASVAIECVAPLAVTLETKFVDQYHAQILAAFNEMLAPTSHPRLIVITGISLVEFVASLEPETLSQYATTLFTSISRLTPLPSLLVQESIVTMLAVLVKVLAEAFRPYFTAFFPAVKQLIVSAVSPQQRALRGKAIECIGTIAEAVGPELFAPEATSVMELLVSIQREPFEGADDPLPAFLVQAESRIAKCMKASFVPFLPYVIPPLLESAAIVNEYAVLSEHDTSDITERPGYETTTLQMRGGLNLRITVNTSLFEEKALACHMLYQYAFDLRGSFLPYVADTAKLMVPLMGYRFHESVRIAACSACPALLTAAADGLKHTPEQRDIVLMQLFSLMFDAFVEVCNAEIQLDNLKGHLEAFADTVTALTVPLTTTQLETACNLICKVICDSRDRQGRREEKRQHPDYDEEEESRIQTENQEEHEMLSCLYMFVAGLIKASGNQFWPHWDRILKPLLHPILQSDDTPWVTLVICMLSELVNGVELPESVRDSYCHDLFVVCCKHALSDDVDLRQSAQHGIGSCAVRLGPAFGPAVEQALYLVTGALRLPDCRDEVQAPATDNAVSSLDKILVHCATVPIVGQRASELWPLWLSFLPINSDTLEAHAVHQVLLERCLANDPLVLGEQGERLQSVMTIIANILESDYLSSPEGEELARRFFSVCRSRLNEASWHSFLMSLDEEDRKDVIHCLQSSQQANS